MELTYRTVLLRALLAGLVAGALLGIYTYVVVEPTIDQAIALEEQLAADAPGEPDDHAHDGDEAAGHSHGDEAMFTRTEQVGGAMVASLLYGVIGGLVLGTVFAALRHRLPGSRDLTRVLWLVAVGFGCVAVLPALTFPANPPAVGDPDTVNERTVGYLATIALGIAAVVGLCRLSTVLRSRCDDATRVAAVAGAAMLALALILVVVPANPDTIAPEVGAQLLWDFRVRSLGALALVWVTLGVGLGLLLERLRPAA